MFLCQEKDVCAFNYQLSFFHMCGIILILILFGGKYYEEF